MYGNVGRISKAAGNIIHALCLKGSDYNVKDVTGTNVNLRNTLKLFNQFKENNNNSGNFYEWLLYNTNYINNINSLKNFFL